MKKHLKNSINFLLLALIAGLVLYFALKDDFNVIIQEILSINIWWLLIAVMLVVCYWFLRALVIKNCVQHFKKDYSFKEASLLTLSTQFFNAITPFSSGGQPFQIYMLNKSGIKATQGTNIVMSEFIAYQFSLVLLGIIAIVSNFIGSYFPKNSLLGHLVTVGFIINFAVIVFLLLISFTKRFNKWVIKWGIKILSKIKIVKSKEITIDKWNQHLNNFHQGAKTIFQNKKLLSKMIIFNFLGLIALYLVPWAIFQGVNIQINPYICVVTSAYVMLIGSFVPIPGGTGGLEYSFMAFFGNFVSGGALNAVMLLWRFITYYLGMIIGSITVNISKGDGK